MQDRIYLFSIADLQGGEEEEVLMQQALPYVDETRRRKFLSIKQSKEKAACLGAGLLLQVAVQEALQEMHLKTPQERLQETAQDNIWDKAYSQGGAAWFIKLSLCDILGRIHIPFPLEFYYGANGKPYLKEYPFYFNLSHSGEYVVCAISEKEIGIDIQEHRENVSKRIAERYFSEGEKRILENCSDEEYIQIFYDFWAKKEAYGKMTGEGIVKSLELDLSQKEKRHSEWSAELQLYEEIPGYSLAVCKAMG